MSTRRSASPRPTKTLVGSTPDRARIRKLFVKRNPFFTLSDVLRFNKEDE
jgi:hypothetical protein